ncbi:MAG: hypothetical protein IK052_04920 [Bacteroidales bacterium]|nr:hypothetical protein [Bacteroidales bacterium]
MLVNESLGFHQRGRNIRGGWKKLAEERPKRAQKRAEKKKVEKFGRKCKKMENFHYLCTQA